jgi:hypothetical protein
MKSHVRPTAHRKHHQRNGERVELLRHSALPLLRHAIPETLLLAPGPLQSRRNDESATLVPPRLGPDVQQYGHGSHASFARSTAPAESRRPARCVP